MHRVLTSRVDQGNTWAGVVRLTNGLAWRLCEGKQVTPEAGAVAEVLSSDGRRWFLAIAGVEAPLEVTLARCQRQAWDEVELVPEDLVMAHP